jgi:Ca-activated chloride channel homolog
MTFLWPHLLWLLVLVPALVAAYVYLLRRKRKAAVRYASLIVVKDALGGGPGYRRHLPPALLLAALTLTLLAVARPAAIVTLPSDRATIIMAMDVSGSMRAADVEPDRITASQLSAIDFINSVPRSTRVGVVAFAGGAQLVQPPTLDRSDLTRSIERFRLQRGTNLGDAILVSLETIFPEVEFDIGPRFTVPGSAPQTRGAPLGEAMPEEESFSPVEPGSYEHAAIVLLTDGRATTGPDPVEVARLAADRGVRVFTVGFGSREGETVGFGGMYMRVGFDEETLRQVAEITRGRYFHAGSSIDLDEIYSALSSQFMMEQQETEITALFSGAAGILVLLSGALSMLWFGRVL